MNRVGHVVALGVCLVLLSSSGSSAQVVLQPSRFFLPRDGQPNDNGYVGPFRGTGRTLVIRTADGYPVGYVYFHDFPGDALMVGSASFATDLTLPISAAIDPSRPDSPHEKGEIAFGAEEMQFEFSRSANVGGLSFTAWIDKAPRQIIDGQWRYVLGSVGVWLQVSALPPADSGGVPDLPDAGGQDPSSVEGDSGIAVGPEQTTDEAQPTEDYRGTIVRGLARLLEKKLFRTKQNRAACSLPPDPGPCKAARQGYYYDAASGRCEAFTWGGCQGVVPFDTLKRCMSSCERR